MDELSRIVAWGDSDFGKDEIMAWCEAHDVDYVFGCGQNIRLNALIARELERSRRRCLVSGKASRRYRDLRYRTRSSWSRERRAVAKVEWLPGQAARLRGSGISTCSSSRSRVPRHTTPKI